MSILISALCLWTAPVLAQSATYTVRDGDTLASIAARYDVAIGDLMTLNGIPNPNTIFTGQLITLPTGADAGTGGPVAIITPADDAALPAQPNLTDTPTDLYTVQPGDNLTRIAALYGVSTADLLALNDLANANFVRRGQVINVPATPTPAPGPAAPSTPARTYTVQAGDILTLLAVELGVTEVALIAANDLDNPSRIFPGQVLVIP